MRRIFCCIMIAVLAAGCQPVPTLLEIGVQLLYDGKAFAEAGAVVTLVEDKGAFRFEAAPDASGVAHFTVVPGSYSASVTYKMIEDGMPSTYNGSLQSIMISEQPSEAYPMVLSKVDARQLVIKELYTGGCTRNGGTGAYYNDAYVIIYNNSAYEVDASNLVFGFLNPYNAQSSNKFYGKDKTLIYADEDWLPAAGAIWSFTSPVMVPAYSQIVVACFGAIDHTSTVDDSVDLSDPSYYWMSNSDVPQYFNAKYAASDAIPTSHYLTCFPINQGNAWVLSTTSPAFFIGNMSLEENDMLCHDTEHFDLTNGTTAVGWSAKFPKSRVSGAVEVYSAANISSSVSRFSKDINAGYVSLVNQKGYTVYRNVDKEATEALPENAGKLVYGYTGGTEDVNGTTDPSGIDAEASIEAGAHIIYAQSNDSGKDFHQRKKASLKK